MKSKKKGRSNTQLLLATWNIDESHKKRKQGQNGIKYLSQDKENRIEDVTVPILWRKNKLRPFQVSVKADKGKEEQRLERQTGGTKVLGSLSSIKGGQERKREAQEEEESE